jgi:hypothetical protein
MTFRSGQRVVCLYDSEAFVAVICGIPLEIPMVQLGIFCPRRGGVYTVAAVIAGWRGGCLELAELGSIWDARSFRAAVDDEFDTLAAIAANPRAALPQPSFLLRQAQDEGEREIVPEAVRPLPPPRTLALSAEAREDQARRAAGGVGEAARPLIRRPHPERLSMDARPSPARGEGGGAT